MKIGCTKYWDDVAMRWSPRSCANELLAEHKRKTYLSLAAGWAKITSNQRILKTDFTMDNKNNLASRAFNLAPGPYRRRIIPCYFVMPIAPRHFERRLTNQ